MKIIKANGEASSYNPAKIVKSLKRAGTPPETIRQVLVATEKELVEGIHTNALYKIVFKNLKKLSHTTAGKYHLKNAMMELGPTGFPFEKFIAAMLEAEGYRTRTDQIIEGHCVKHEVDVIAESDHEIFMMECKFHAIIGNVCDVKDALYVHARFADIKKKWNQDSEQEKEFLGGWLVTNTRLSGDAEKYGTCVGLKLLSWNYPKSGSLRERIDQSGLYPITCLTTLSKIEKQKLLDKAVVLCRTICERPATLNSLALTETRKEKVLTESRNICRHH